jgi:hypothetical protein
MSAGLAFLMAVSVSIGGIFSVVYAPTGAMPPIMPPDAPGFHRTAPDKKKAENPVFTGVSGLYRTASDYWMVPRRGIKTYCIKG